MLSRYCTLILCMSLRHAAQPLDMLAGYNDAADETLPNGSSAAHTAEFRTTNLNVTARRAELTHCAR